MSFTWAEFTLLMVPSIENFVCISLITFSLGTLAAGIWAAKSTLSLMDDGTPLPGKLSEVDQIAASWVWIKYHAARKGATILKVL